MIQLLLNYDRVINKNNHFFLRELILFLLLALMISAVTAIQLPQMSWTSATPHAQFSHKQGQSTVVFDDKMWVIGGWAGDYSCAGDSCNDEVWYSTDGVDWILVTKHAGFGGRYDHRSVIFDNKIWVIGGRNTTSWNPMNDVWYSSNGVDWTLATNKAPFVPRWDFGLTVFDNKMWVIGGSEDGPIHNDVWYSSDGVNWVRATDHAGFSPRMDLTATTFDGKIWVTGGFDWKSHFNDIWYSENGIKWTQVTSHASYPARRYHTTAVADNKMWVIGGIGGVDPYNWKYLTDVWYSSDGLDWTEATAHAEFPGRYSFSSAVFDHKLWVIAGTAGNDVWYSPEIETSTGEMKSPGSSAITLKNQSVGILISKSISPKSLKQGTDARIIITIFNDGPTPIHDIEILDTTIPEFPVTKGITQYSAPSIEPNETRILSYTVHAIKPGTFRLNRTAVMYADLEGNYHITYSNYEKVEVLPPLIAITPKEASPDFFRDLLNWIQGQNPFA